MLDSDTGEKSPCNRGQIDEDSPQVAAAARVFYELGSGVEPSWQQREFVCKALRAARLAEKPAGLECEGEGLLGCDLIGPGIPEDAQLPQSREAEYRESEECEWCNYGLIDDGMSTLRDCGHCNGTGKKQPEPQHPDPSEPDEDNHWLERQASRRWPGVPGRWEYEVRFYGGNLFEFPAPGLVEASQLAAEIGRVVSVKEIRPVAPEPTHPEHPEGKD